MSSKDNKGNKGNKGNLRSFANIPKAEHIEISRRGGIASGKSRARRSLICQLTDYYFDKAFFYGARLQDMDILIDTIIDTLADMSDEELTERAKIARKEKGKLKEAWEAELNEFLNTDFLFE